ncbi:MAG: EthD family reductase [Peristeroidobacter soli]
MNRRNAISALALGLAAQGVRAADTLPSTAGIKFMVLYGHPPKPEEFEKYYLGTHMPLVAEIKGARKMEAAKCLPQADGSPPAFYRVFEMWFDSPEHMTAVFATPEGVKVRADLKNFTEGTTVTRVVSKLD